MFQMVCKYLRKRIDSGLPALSVSVNVSRLALFQKDFIEFYTETKKAYRIPDGLLDLEFTESIVFKDYAFFNNTVKILQKNGFLCSMDDFGSGYSSLNVLKDISIDILKLDMLFFQGNHSDPRRGQIVISNIIAMARELNIVTIAEGVEQIGQVDFLRRVGCNLIQGYTFSKPLPYADFDRLYQNSHGRLPL